MARFYVTQKGPYDNGPLSKGGSFIVWDELRTDPLHEFHWYEQTGKKLNRPDWMMTQVEAREKAYAKVRELEQAAASGSDYARRK
ncbi:hypothetical protein QZM43_09815 [Burkholderia orbicola]|uniref:hypothetical protein n=1 Tax=Burkholderia orbicola TaxID=2978683 RepID=UPI0026562E42|nr:hypothetical protein [Burkholderia orbicola]ELW9447699.1 hypothetical protein [Burkholderia cenocepacia]MDN7467431.1 hypothetical protein [Burkholderia orbicola]MDN7503021.1 hypothetical protein [Burkholderia orbicola]